MKELNELFVIAWMLFGIYMLVLLLIGADLWSGYRKAKQRGEARTSYMLREIVDKIARYYNALLALTFIDCMQMGGIWFLDNYYDWHIPIFPLVTLLGAIAFGAIEVKSIYEKAEDKMKDDYRQVAILAAEIAKHKNEPDKMIHAVDDFMNKNNKGNKEEQK